MIKFGTGGWRAIIGDDFTKANIQILAKAMCDKMKAEKVAQKGLVMGYDRRFLSKETVKWSCEVFAAEGIHVWFVNRSVPTPLIMNYVMKYDLPYGMMVTASHNPSLYNGIKVFTAGGRDADQVQTADIERFIEAVEPRTIATVPYAQAVEQGQVTEFYPMNEYIDDIMSKINMEAIRDAHLRIAIDPMYGVGQGALSTILITGRCDVEVIHQEHDTLFGGRMPAPSADLLHMLRTRVMDKGYDMGLALDGDADRLGVIDDRGNYLHPNDILVLLYYYLVKYKGWKGPVVRNLATTHRLDAIAESFGQVCLEVPVGFKHISAGMAESGAILGGAASLRVEMVAVTGRKLSELMAVIRKEYGVCHMEENSYTFAPERKEGLMQRIYADQELPELPFAIARISYMDGCKVYFENGGWVVIRFSGTEPLLRVFCEMSSRSDAAKVCDLIKAHFGI